LEVSDERAAEVVALDEALTALAEFDPRKSRMVELRFFGGLSIEETAAVLGVSPGTVMRDWTLAKTWLQHEINKRGDDAGRTLATNRATVSRRTRTRAE
jgi:RNA polymerase sigma factor (sigma-70 family)